MNGILCFVKKQIMSLYNLHLNSMDLSEQSTLYVSTSSDTETSVVPLIDSHLFAVAKRLIVPSIINTIDWLAINAMTD